MKKISKVLIANRGEIACRIIHTCRQLGIATVAVYSDVDRCSPHVRLADEALFIGEAPASSSYLNMDRILESAVSTKSDAIHPGYGFLSENAEFAQKVIDAGLLFLGPDPDAIRTMGNKLDAKKAVSAYDIAMVPGTEESVQDLELATSMAKKIGLPILVKANAGGGGKGMRKVSNIEDIESSIQQAMSEAKASFGDSSVFIEKYIENPRHIEIQIAADRHGNILHLLERECSIQRRHQKVIEEAPSPVMTDDLRTAMGEAAIKVAKSCNYVGLGTVEFLLDSDGLFYFLEMNTRLQVEHPVTEMITKLDLVEFQIRIAEGHPLPFSQQDIQADGHSIELRVYAEDPENQFIPSIGTLTTYQLPKGMHIRVDDGLEQGMEITIYYDPMIAKLIVWGTNREEARKRMIWAIDHYQISGIKTTLPFGAWAMRNSYFISGDIHTHFIQDHYSPTVDNPISNDEDRDIAQIAVCVYNDLIEMF